MPDPSHADEQPKDVLARTRLHAARLVGELSRQRASLAAADARHVSADSAAEGVAAIDAVIAAGAAVTRATHNLTPGPTPP